MAYISYGRHSYLVKIDKDSIKLVTDTFKEMKAT